MTQKTQSFHRDILKHQLKLRKDTLTIFRDNYNFQSVILSFFIDILTYI